MTTTTLAPDVVTLNEARVLLALAAQSETAAPPVVSAPRDAGSTPAGVAVSGSLSDVMACIRHHESGNYTEQSHVYDGSGAYQMIPSTWRAWSARAGYPGYEYAYQAPAAVQDAVTAYTLTNGGAGNWSMRWGNDPCSASLPGGG